MEENIFEKGCLISFNVSTWGGRVKLPSKDLGLDENVDPEFIGAIKRLVDKDCLKPIEEIRNATRTWLYQKSLPFPIAGVLFVPKALIETIDKKLQDAKTEFNTAVMHFENDYNCFVLQAQSKLGKYFDSEDYPQNIHNKFGFSWRFFVIDSLNGKSLISPEIMAREQEKYREAIKDFSDMAITTLRTKFAELIEHMIERLEGREKKVFRDSMIDNIREFFHDFVSLNINNDEELKVLIDRSQAILNGVSPATLRSSNDLRSAIHGSMEEIQQRLDHLMVDRPIRKIVRKAA